MAIDKNKTYIDSLIFLHCAGNYSIINNYISIGW